MADHVVDRDAGGVAVALVADRRRGSPRRRGSCRAPPVSSSSVLTPGRHQRRDPVEDVRRQPAGHPHAGEVLGGMDADAVLVQAAGQQSFQGGLSRRSSFPHVALHPRLCKLPRPHRRRALTAIGPYALRWRELASPSHPPIEKPVIAAPGAKWALPFHRPHVIMQIICTTGGDRCLTSCGTLSPGGRTLGAVLAGLAGPGLLGGAAAGGGAPSRTRRTAGHGGTGRPDRRQPYRGRRGRPFAQRLRPQRR